MVSTLLKRVGLIAALILLLADPADLSSCGPFFPHAVFTRPNAPDSEQVFFHGRLGILQPSYERRYLAMAYRMLRGEPLRAAQIASVSNLERYRVSDVDAAIHEWLAARARVPGNRAVQIDPYKQQSNFANYDNCNADAFRTALQTLQNLIEEAGAGSAEVRDWLDAQDQVFAVCGGAASIPDPLPAASSARARANRAYQIAAAEFYTARFDEARAAFLEIAADTSSSWHVLAPYLVARCFLRQDDYAAAEKQLKAVLADPRESSIHAQTTRLLDFARAHLEPGTQLVTLSKRMMQPDASDLGHALNDYTFLFDRLANGPAPCGPGDPPDCYQAFFRASSSALNTASAQDELTDWIRRFEGGGGGKRPDFVELWRRNNSLPWLIQALYWANEKTPQSEQLIAAARALSVNSPAYATARFEAVRLLIEGGQKPDAASLVDDVLQQPGTRPPLDISTSNAFRAERMAVARNFQDFLAYAPRTMVPHTSAGGWYEDFDLPVSKSDTQPLAMFDADGASIFNDSLPLALWFQAVQSGDLANRLRIQLAQSGWVRAVILNDRAHAFARELIRLKPAYASGLEPHLAARDPAAQRFEAVFFILHHPELQPAIRAGLARSSRDGTIDDFRDNWWSSSRPSPPGVYPVYPAPFEHPILSPLLLQLYSREHPPNADFLTGEEREQAAKEQERLKAAGGAPSFLSTSVISWTKSHPSDPRNPEALALAVKTSRFSPSDPNSSKTIPVAFRLLHERYAKTSWAQRTPYWY